MMSLPSVEEVRDLIKARVRDPELMMNIIDLGLVYDIAVNEDKTIDVTMTLTSPGCPAGPEIISSVQRETHVAFPDIDEVNIKLVWTPFWTPEMMSDEAKDELGIF
jgi:metal-sulfur cluster biosynthetic enzyme